MIMNCEFFYNSQTFDSHTYSINSQPLHTICADAIIIRNVAKKGQMQQLNYAIEAGPTVCLGHMP